LSVVHGSVWASRPRSEADERRSLWHDLGMKSRMERFAEICRRHRVALAYAFGSRGSELVSILHGAPPIRSGPMADLDLGVAFGDPTASPPAASLEVYCDELELMAGYRNRLVHFYAQVTPGELCAIIRGNLADLKEFVRAI
jgi:hypothetical protein